MSFQLGPNQTKWLAALRSGEYQQGKYELYADGKYCCLGVANKVCNLQEEGESSLLCTYGDMGLYTDAGSVKNISLHGDSDYCSLIELNDTREWSFLDIADFIEANAERVFKESK